MRIKKYLGLAALIGVTSFVLSLGFLTVGRGAISELVGIAVAQTSTKWSNVADASRGDGLSSGVIAGSPYLFNGLTFDRLRGTPSSDGGSGTGSLASVMSVFNGTTYDRLRGGLTSDAQAATGILAGGMFGFNGSTWDRIRSSVAADGQAATGLLSSENFIFNGSTWDRLRTASGDNLAATGIAAAGNVGFDGSTWDRVISVSNTNNTATTTQGVRYYAPISTWSVTNTPGTGTSASASRAAGGGTVRHVATSVTICIAANATAQTPLLVHLRDGATGAGTIIRSWAIATPVTSSQCIDLSGLNMTGSANTAMTLETSAAPVSGAQATVTLTGYSTP